MNNKAKTTSPSEPRTATVETLGPGSKTRKFKIKAKIFIPVLSILLVFGLASGNYILKAEKDSASEFNSEAITLNQEAAALNTEPALKRDFAATSDVVLTPDKEKPEEQKTIVVFEPEGIFAEKEKQELMNKLVNPMVDYQPETFAAFHIEIYSMDKFVGGDTDDKYIVTTIGKEGSSGNGGFLYGSKKKGLEYWTPDCIGICEFSDDYKKKHPAVIEKYQP